MLRQFGQAHGATTVINETRAEALAGGKDHFGFFDGIAQPAVAGSGVEARPGDGQPDGAGGWRDVCTGEFLHGHIDEDGGLPDAPARAVRPQRDVRGLPQAAMDVAAFRRYMEEKGREYPGGPDMLAAKIVGRWRDGTPLALSPDGPDPDIVDDPARINDFSYADDPRGCAARSARTSAAPTRATPRASSRAG